MIKNVHDIRRTNAYSYGLTTDSCSVTTDRPSWHLLRREADIHIYIYIYIYI